MSLRVQLTNHGPSGHAVYADVDAVEGNVHLTFDGETDDDTSTWRVLTFDEARALAAALYHYAREAAR